jgi:hypothetical protein
MGVEVESAGAAAAGIEGAAVVCGAEAASCARNGVAWHNSIPAATNASVRPDNQS